MRENPISHFVRQLSGRGALDNVSEVLAARACVDAELAAFTARVTPTIAVGPSASVDHPAAA